MTKECLELIYSEVKEKGQQMNTWKGTLKTKIGNIQEKYLKVPELSVCIICTVPIITIAR